jgi:hypothetical protein
MHGTVAFKGSDSGSSTEYYYYGMYVLRTTPCNKHPQSAYGLILYRSRSISLITFGTLSSKSASKSVRKRAHQSQATHPFTCTIWDHPTQLFTGVGRIYKPPSLDRQAFRGKHHSLLYGECDTKKGYGSE